MAYISQDIRKINIYNNMLLKPNKIKSEMISSYCSVLKLYFINYHFSINVFNILHIDLIIKGEKKLFLKQKVICLLILKDIIEKFIKNKLVELNKLNINIIFKIM